MKQCSFCPQLNLSSNSWLQELRSVNFGVPLFYSSVKPQQNIMHVLLKNSQSCPCSFGDYAQSSEQSLDEIKTPRKKLAYIFQVSLTSQFFHSFWCIVTSGILYFGFCERRGSLRTGSLARTCEKKSWRAKRVKALRCVLRQDTLLSVCLSSPRCINGYRRIYCWG